MFSFAILIGIYSYIIFSLGLLGFLYKQNILLVTFIYLFVIIFIFRQKFNLFKLKDSAMRHIKKTSKMGLVLLSLLVIQSTVNFIGALGPELGFDALWYHLTLPKIYLINHTVDYIPGGLLYYSAMPKLTEMLYVVGLALGSEIFAKIIHFSFGILSLFALYSLSRKILSKTFSLLVIILFYSNLVVGWMSITAYVDLARTFFEIMALWGFVNWIEKKDRKWLIISSILLGLAISVKLLVLGSLIIFSILIIKLSHKISNLIIYLVFALFIPLPWFIFSLIHTGSPIYPFFSNIYPVKVHLNLINPLNLSDPISPLYVLFLPIGLFIYKKLKPTQKIIFLYSFIAIIIWFLTPQTGGGRFILPYLPAFSILSIVVIQEIIIIKTQRVLIGAIVVLSLFSIIYRFGANFKYFSVILGKELKANFLAKNLNFSYGDFYDTDGYFAKKIKERDMVLLYGFHNLYYIKFPFIDSSYAKKGDKFNYVAIQNSNLPKRFIDWKLIYSNRITHVKLYSKEDKIWEY